MTGLMSLVCQHAGFLVLEAVVGMLGALLISKYGSHFGLIDLPSCRSSHSIPTPKGGGVGILAAFFISCVWWGVNFLWCLPAVILSLISLLDDRGHIAPIWRLVAQFVAAGFVIFSMLCNSCQLFSPVISTNDFLLSIVMFWASIVFLVGTANFYNFMDGINGMAAITAMVAFGLLSVYGVINQKPYQFIMVCAGLGAGCAGFLPFNLLDAKVFMGDAGSVLLGFVFAAAVLSFVSDFKEFVLLSSFLLPFYADELYTMWERVADRQSLLKPHRRHLYQVLANEAGIAHWKVSLSYGAFQLVTGMFLWQAYRLGDAWLIFSMICIWILFGWANRTIKKRYLPRKMQDSGY